MEETAFIRSKELEKLAEEVLAENKLMAAQVSIIYLNSGKSKRKHGRICFADTEKVKPKYRCFLHCDFVITFYKDAQYLTKKALKVLMLHELRHVGYDGEKVFIVPHDVEDFRGIISAYGVDWATIGEEET